MTKQQVVTITFFRYERPSNMWWAFRQMGLVGPLLSAVKGLTFSKVLGSGAKDGFSVWPNFKVYGLLCCWETKELAKQFFDADPLYLDFKNHSTEQWTVYMQNTMAHGQWDGQNPFQKTAQQKDDRLVGVLTRATIKTKHLLHFWRFVPSVSESVQDMDGRLFSVGVGELPIVQQATFSFWKSSELMKAYAYKSKYHKEVVQKTRQLGWYKEELFARFAPYQSTGTWNGVSLLDAYL